MLENFIRALTLRQKTLIVSMIDGLLAILAFYTSFSLRYEQFNLPRLSSTSFYLTFIIAIATQIIVFQITKLYRGIWRYTSIPDLVKLVKAVSFASIATATTLFLFNRVSFIPRSVLIIDWFLLIVFLGGVRFGYRMWRDNQFQLSPTKIGLSRALIIGSGPRAEQLFREIRANRSLQLYIVGFVSEDKYLKGKTIHGCSVLGTIEDLSNIVTKSEIKKIFISLPDATGKQLRQIVDATKNKKIELKTLPKLADIINSKFVFSQLRTIKPEDLLGRQQVNLDKHSIEKLLKDKTVFVSGAGGSIGSELCKQIARFPVKELIIFDNSEHSLYQIDRHIQATFPKLKVQFFLGDVRDSERLSYLFQLFAPQIIFHAAAYKHVPIVELNPYEAIKTNIIGTKTIVECAQKFNVEKFVQVSTDKAVNPTNVMGATKRIAEMVVQSRKCNTKFMTVRFGNVLGSSGSVIPLFQEQINKGGPITITHPEITRYFMSIAEAAQLVLQAGAIGHGGEIFVLDMGDPVKIMDLARQMINSYGLIEGEDIEVKITGLRPGEKLYEELLHTKETTLPTIHPLLKIAKVTKVDKDIDGLITPLLKISPSASLKEFRDQLKLIVPEYVPQNIPEEIETAFLNLKNLTEGNLH